MFTCITADISTFILRTSFAAYIVRLRQLTGINSPLEYPLLPAAPFSSTFSSSAATDTASDKKKMKSACKGSGMHRSMAAIEVGELVSVAPQQEAYELLVRLDDYSTTDTATWPECRIAR